MAHCSQNDTDNNPISISALINKTVAVCRVHYLRKIDQDGDPVTLTFDL